jgi:hypothetical protein
VLKSRTYNKNVIKMAVGKALQKDRKDALKRADKKKKKERVFFFDILS